MWGAPFFVLNIAQGGNYFLVCLTPNAFPTGGDEYPVIECTRKHAFPFALLSFIPPSVRCSPFMHNCCCFINYAPLLFLTVVLFIPFRNHDWIISCIFFAAATISTLRAPWAKMLRPALQEPWVGHVGVFVVASLTKANYYRMTMQKSMIASNNKALHSRSILSCMIFHFFFSKPSPWFLMFVEMYSKQRAGLLLNVPKGSKNSFVRRKSIGFLFGWKAAKGAGRLKLLSHWGLQIDYRKWCLTFEENFYGRNAMNWNIKKTAIFPRTFHFHTFIGWHNVCLTSFAGTWRATFIM